VFEHAQVDALRAHVADVVMSDLSAPEFTD
jgi:hypothetical protein